MRDRIKESMHIIDVLTRVMEKPAEPEVLSSCCDSPIIHPDGYDLCSNCLVHIDFTESHYHVEGDL